MLTHTHTFAACHHLTRVTTGLVSPPDLLFLFASSFWQGSERSEERWSELKELAFSRTIVACYALVLLILRLRVYLNIVARHYMLETTASERSATKPSPPLSRTTKLRFLSLEQLTTEGFEPLVSAVRTAVRHHLDSVRLDEQLNPSDIRR